MAKMTLHDALTILQITSIDNLSLTEFKRIKREKIKFLHPDRKQSLAEKEFFHQELAIANVALDIVEAELKRHQTQKKSHQQRKSSNKSNSYSKSSHQKSRAQHQSSNRQTNEQHRRQAAEQRRREASQRRQQEEQRQREEARRRQQEEARWKQQAAERRRRQQEEARWKQQAAERRRRKQAETKQIIEEILQQRQAGKVNELKLGELKQIVESRKLCLPRIMANYILCAMIFFFTGKMAFIFALICVLGDYLAFKYFLACTTKPHYRLGGLIEIFKSINNDKKVDPLPSIYPFSRFVIDMALLAITTVVLLLLVIGYPLALLLLCCIPFYIIWRIVMLVINSLTREKRIIDFLAST